MRYKAIFIDIDDTILDYIPCCREAFMHALEALRNEAPEAPDEAAARMTDEEWFQIFFSISGRLFSEAKHGLHTIAEVMEMYPREFVGRWNELTHGGEGDLTAQADTFKHAFRAAWGQTYVLVPGARETLEALRAKGYRLFAASNSFGHLQRSRLEQAGVLHLFEDTYISMDIGYDKPDMRFYTEALRRCGVPPQDVLMVGDSMTTDILGARAAGIDGVYFNKRGEEISESERNGLRVISSLPELLALL